MFDQFGRLCDDFRDIGYASAAESQPAPYVFDEESARSLRDAIKKRLEKGERKIMGYDCSSYSLEAKVGDCYVPMGNLCTLEEVVTEWTKRMFFCADYLTPKRILRSGPATIVFWQDGTKTIVKRCLDDAIDSPYTAFTAALAIKIFGSNSKLKKMVKTLTEEQK